MENTAQTDPFLAGQQALQSEVEKLRVLHPDTQTLYQEVCILMFFRYGITPTSNKLYQLVRKGSMSAPAEALNRFWQNLRDKSRVRIEQADLPEPLRDTAGQLIAELWKKAQLEAQQLQAVFRDACEQAVQQAVQATDASLVKIQELENSQIQQQHALESQNELTQSAQLQLAQAKQAISVLQNQANTQMAERVQLQETLNKLHQQHAQELEKQRQHTDSVAQQHAEDTRRKLLDLDRERLTAAKLQKSMDQLQRLQAEQSVLHRSETEAFALQLFQSQAAEQSALRSVANMEGTVAELRQQLLASIQEIKAQNIYRVSPPALQPNKATLKNSLRTVRATAKQMVLRKPQALQKNRSAQPPKT